MYVCPFQEKVSTPKSKDNRGQHPSQKSDVAIQTDFVDAMHNLKEQVRLLSKIVDELTTLKPKKEDDIKEGFHGSLLTQLLSDLLGDITEMP